MVGMSEVGVDFDELPIAQNIPLRPTGNRQRQIYHGQAADPRRDGSDAFTPARVVEQRRECQQPRVKPYEELKEDGCPETEKSEPPTPAHRLSRAPRGQSPRPNRGHRRMGVEEDTSHDSDIQREQPEQEHGSHPRLEPQRFA